MDVSLLPKVNVTLFNELAPAKVPYPIDLTLAGIVNDVTFFPEGNLIMCVPVLLKSTPSTDA